MILARHLLFDKQKQEDDMAFSDKDLHAQEQQIQILKEELSRLNTQFDAQLKGLGISEDDLLAALDTELPPELQKMMSEAQDKAKREGAARSAQSAPAPVTGAKAPGTGRRGVVRL
jgi:septal ring factor EnvC (AmiA/AmiB activator)